MDGLLIIDKPKGMTSQSVCLKLKRIFGLKKCGHNGTLDPNATGVMVVACDRATKLLRLVSEHDKEYIATILFGLETTTLDLDGEILSEVDMNIKMEDIEKSLVILKERKTQIPPMTSAVKINGKKLYEYQRKNIEIEVPEREVTLKNYEILSDLRYVDNHFEIDLKIEVSKGYFVRSLARDLGELLGGKAIIKELRRTKSGIYSIENAKALDEVKESDIIPVSKFFDFKKIKVLDYLIPLVKNGITIDERQTSTKGVFYVDSSKGILAIYEEVEPLKYKPIYFFEEDE